MRLKYNFLVSEVAGRIIAVPSENQESNFNGYLSLNKTGKIIFEMLKEDVTEEQIALTLNKKFPEATQDELKENIKEFLDELRNEDMLI